MSIMQELFKTTSDDAKQSAITKLINNSFPSADFYLMVILSVCMASFGLIIDSPAIIIGSMLIAPVLHPILAISMGIIVFNDVLTSKSLRTLLKSVLFALIAAFVVGLLFADKEVVQSSSEILSRTSLNITHILVAIVAGFASAFALVKKKLSETLPGIAISVALVPPLAVTGVALSTFNFSMARGAFSLFFVNVLGVILASAMVFSLMNFYTARKKATEVIVQEEQEAQVRKNALQQADKLEKEELETIREQTTKLAEKESPE
jgi:uncharacterized hydrophobic protein (TIGR00271 family)